MNKQPKNYYQILGVPATATIYQIEHAYQKLTNELNPENFKGDTVLAHTKLDEITEAFEVLYDQKTKAHYDSILHRQFSIGDAENTFEKFFQDNGFLNKEESEIIGKIYAQNQKNVKDYYATLGLDRNAGLEQINAAYRQLAVKYHPKNVGSSSESLQNFIEINQAYNVLSHASKKTAYDSLLHEIIPKKIYRLYEDFFGHQPFEYPSGEEYFKPNLKKKWSRMLDRLMDCEEEFGDLDDGESVREATVQIEENGVVTKKHCKVKRVAQHGAIDEVKTQQYQFQDGDREITQTHIHNGKPDTKKFRLKAGDPTPSALLQ